MGAVPDVVSKVESDVLLLMRQSTSILVVSEVEVVAVAANLAEVGKVE